jgi:hypothetical protein
LECIEIQVAPRNTPYNSVRQLTLKEMRELVSDLAAPSFRRKVQAIDFILALPDARDRIARAIPFRTLFKLNALPPQFSGLDLTQVASWWSCAAEIAFILAHTYRFAHYQANTSESDNQLNHPDSFIKGWKILATDDSCPCCQHAAKKRFPRTKYPQVPLHIACRCCVVADIDE